MYYVLLLYMGSKYFINILAAALCAVLFAGCGRPVEVEWDAASLKRVTSGVYGRVKALSDGRLMLVYSDGPAVCLRTSSDGGDSWSEASEVARDGRYNYTNSELLELRDGRLLYLWNARPREAGTCEYKIMGAVSDDSDTTWRVRDIFHAGVHPSEGCWESVALQLPDGHVELFFADESPYGHSDEQQISMMRSDDGGETWGTVQCVSFRRGARDGMPVPVYLPRRDEVVVAIEDNGLAGRFKPVTVRSSEGWRDGCVEGDSPRRMSALKADEQLHDTIYAGAPYLLRLHDGRTLLSVQSTEGRSGVNERYANMQVYAGDRNAENFSHRTTPWPDLPPEGNALWNSLCQTDDHTVMAVMSVGGIKGGGIWTVKGRLR